MELEVYHQADQLKDNHWWFLGRKEIIISVLREFLPKSFKGKILDAGCGAATSLPILSSFGQVFGVDNSEEAIKFCRRKNYFQLKKGNITKLPYQDNFFSLVAALDLLEHVKDESKALGELHRVCQKNGWLIITVPAFSFLWSENDISTHHQRRYTSSDLREKIEQHGFKVEKISYLNFFLFPLFLLWLIIDKLKLAFLKKPKAQSTLSISLPKMINQFLTFIFSSESIFLPKINFPFGLSLICLAREEKHA